MRHPVVRFGRWRGFWLGGLALALAAGPVSFLRAGGLLREVYLDVTPFGATSVDALLSNPKYPDSPDSSEIIVDFEAPTDVEDNYGQRVRGYLVPPSTGNYVFWISSDDNSVLNLSADTSPITITAIANVPGWTAPRQWDVYPEQQSAPILLEANHAYYVEALMKEGYGGDNLAVRWRLPDGTIEEPIPEVRLLPWGTAFIPPQITVQPVDTTVVENQPATFRVEVANDNPVIYQWQRNQSDLAGATAATLTLPYAALADEGARFRCRLSNELGVQLSSEATLHVTPDRDPPTLSAAQNIGLNVVTVRFSERVEPASATNSSHYVLDGGVAVRAARLGGDPQVVELDTSDLTFDTTYTVTVNGVRDLAKVPNTIAPDSRILFMAAEFTPVAIGNPKPPGSATPAPGGVDMVGSGTGVGAKADQLYFGYRKQTGNFDVRARVQSLEWVNVWATAGLMARATLATNSPLSAVLATPSITGISFVSRVTTNATTTTGFFPVNYPYTWLRLQRAGDLFSGYASLDGQIWTLVDAKTNPLPATVFLGLAASSQSTGQVVHVEFRDFATVTNAVTGGLPPAFEPLGPSSRRTGLVISEIMYHPRPRADGLDLEFIELFNSLPTAEDLSGLRLAGSIDFTFPPETVLAPGSFLVVARAPADVRTVSGLTNVVGGYSTALPRGQGTIGLVDRHGGVLLEVNYSDQPPWPAAADGAGHSLVLARPSFGENDPRAWDASQLKDGSPGAIDAVRPNPWASVVINELLIHTDLPQRDYVELYNHSARPVDVSGAFLSDAPDTNRFRIPDGTTIGAAGFLGFTQDDLGFNLSSAGETVYLVSPDGSRVIDAVRFGAQANGIAFGRFPDGAPGFHELQALTPGGANAGLLVRDVVINEIMYHPSSGLADDQYVELYNRGTTPVSLASWRFIDGINYVFPTNAVLPADGYLVVARNAARLMTNYSQLNAQNTYGDFQGQLSHAGERLTLARPDDPALPNQDFVVVDSVTYGDGGRWGRWSDGGGSSLELTDPRSDHRLAPNWADSDETAKAPWTVVEATGVLELGNDTFGINTLQIMLMGEGECLVDDVEVIGPQGINLVANPSFETDDTLTPRSWTLTGTHTRSSLDTTDGYQSRQSLHLRASGRGATDSNNARVELLAPLTPGSYATLRAKVRWLKGNPEILLRLRGNYLEAAGRMTLPANPGTPGAGNTRATANAAPAIFDVRHDPILPALGQLVRVTARVHDPDGVWAVRLKYQVEGVGSLLTVAMVDDGTAGDAAAGDGLYTATIPAQATNNLVRFYLQATDDSAGRVSGTFPVDAPARWCLVRWGETLPPGNFGAYRIWITQETLNEWASRPPSSNDPLDATFAYGNYRVVYNMSALYSGSPFHWTGYNSPLGSPCNYMLVFPSDDLFLGAGDFILNLPSNLGSDPAAQREQLFYWMARELGRPYTHRRFVHFFLNGVRRGSIFEDAQQPNSDVVQEWFPNDPNGELFKIDDWFEFDDTVMGFVNTDATLDDFVSADGQKKRERYRWSWRHRAVKESAHDYTRLFALVDAVNTPGTNNYTQQVEALIDVESWMGTFALRHVVGDWDAYGYTRGKNMYAYKPVNGRWQFLDWDISFDFGLGDGTTMDLFYCTHFDGTVDRVSERMYNHPPFRRTYLRALYDAVNGPLISTNCGPVLDARYAALRANGVNVSSPSSIKTWIQSRRTYIRSVLATNAADFAILSNGGADFTVSDQNLVSLTGTAPVWMRTLRVNGIAYPVTWTSVTNWSLAVPLKSGVNALTVEGYDTDDNRVPNGAQRIQVTFTGADERPEDHLVISEIMYHPAVADAGYVEIHNTSSHYAFDLSSYRLQGVDFTFAVGTIIPPGGYLVVVSDLAAFTTAYGPGIPVAGQFAGRLRNDGETLSLVKPGALPGQEIVVNQVTYSDSAPWPGGADGQGPSLQLIDLTQDNRRVANWTAAAGSSSTNAGWKLATVTGTAAASTLSLYAYLASSGEVYLDDVWLSAGPTAETDGNLVKNGGFETALAGTWTISDNDPNTATTTSFKHGGQSSLHVVSTYGGVSLMPSVSQTGIAVTAGATYTLSFWYLAGTSSGGLTVGLLGSDLEKTVSLVSGPVGPAPATPGAPNSVQAVLPAFPPLWINELQSQNVTGRTDAAGEHDPWLELYNAGTNAVVLNGLYLTDDFTNLVKWPFPAAATIPAGGYLLVWADGQPAQSTAAEFHTTFRLSPTQGSIALVQVINGQPRVLDHVVYDSVPADLSLGSYPDGDPNARQVFHVPTPGGPNSNVVAPIVVRINEWMASNHSTLFDPADGQFDDWFELYNPNAFAADLSSYTLTDDLTRPAQWMIPVGTTIGPRGFLLVWADNQPGQSQPGLGLHANFKLSQNGESIGLFAPDGRRVDVVTFGLQTPDVSEGLFPDGGAGPAVVLTKPTPGQPNLFATTALTITGISVSADSTTLVWTSRVGSVYQVQYKADLNQSTWGLLSGELTATGPTLTFVDVSSPEATQRFYRVVLVR